MVIALQRSSNFPSRFFELIEAASNNSWFYNLLMVSNCVKTEKCNFKGDFQQINNLKRRVMRGSTPEIICPSYDQSNLIQNVKNKISRTPLGKKILFFIEPLISGGAIGEFVINAIAKAGLHLSDIQQITLDSECLGVEKIPHFSEGPWSETSDLMFCKIYDKFRDSRKSFFLPEPLPHKIMDFLEVSRELNINHFPKKVEAARIQDFLYKPQFPNTYSFLMQYAGRHLSANNLYSCFLILLFDCSFEGEGKLITPRFLRKCMIRAINENMPEIR